MVSLSNTSSAATEETNTTGQPDPILSISPADGLFFRFLGMVARGDERGIPVYFKLRDSSNNQLPVDTSVRLEYEAPGDEQRTRVSQVIDNIQSWRNLTISDQQNEEYVDSVKIPLLGERVDVRDIDTFYVTVDSSAAVDWANSELYFEEAAVDRGRME